MELLKDMAILLLGKLLVAFSRHVWDRTRVPVSAYTTVTEI